MNMLQGSLILKVNIIQKILKPLWSILEFWLNSIDIPSAVKAFSVIEKLLLLPDQHPGKSIF